MFGALNRFIGRLDGDPQEQRGGGKGACGFQILRNSNNELPLEPWFDHIIGINGRTLDNGDPGLFASEIQNCAGSTISLGVWSAKGQRIREIFVPLQQGAASLGLSLQWTPLAATEDVWHILEVTPNSPADIAGLLPYGDYVIASSAGIMRGEAGLGELVEDHLERPLRLLVYNHEYDVTRPVDITPSRSWGGQGALGCTLGYGALHRIPAPLDEPPTGPGETMFDTQFNEKQPYVTSNSPIPNQFTSASGISPPVAGGDFLVPAEMDLQSPQIPSPGTGPPPKRDRKARAHHQISAPNSTLDDYFNEGEAKSKEQDFAPTPKAAGLPPPPKAGPPPKTSSPAIDS